MRSLLILWGCFTLVTSSLTWLRSFKSGHGKLTKIAINSQTNDVYVGGMNAIYHLDSELKEKQYLNIKTTTFTNNIVTVLEIEPNLEYLLSCGTIRQGVCEIHGLKNITNKTSTFDNKVESLIGSRKSVVAFFGRSRTAIPYLYVAMAYDGRTTNKYPYAISERKIQKSNSFYKISYRENFDYITANTSYSTEFVYGFEYNNFIFYVSVRFGNSTFLLRVCEAEGSYYYIEMKINCWVDEHALHYSTAARFTYLNGKPTLIVSFWKEHKTSAICHYNMEEIKRRMKRQIKECSSHTNGFQKASRWVVTDKECTEVAVDTITEDTCGIADNVYSSIVNPFALTARLEQKKYITAIQIYTLDHIPVHLLGTNDGHLLKIRKIGTKTHTIMDYDVSQGSGHPIERDLELVGNKTAYVLSGSKVIRFSLDSCDVYSSCRTCVTSKDVMKCGWCLNKCTSHAECEGKSWNPDLCVPVITSFSPTSGPFEGNTLLTIRGDYFTNENSSTNIEVLIKETACIVQSYQETMITCLTKQSKDDTGNVHIKVDSRSFSITQPNITGQDTITESFKFFDPKIFNYTPKFGPKSGGTRCTFNGEKLNIGSTATVIINSKNFTNILRKDNQIFADTPAVDSPIDGVIKVIIDGKIMKLPNKYNYTEDPIINSVNSTLSIQSGGIMIDFLGKNLNTVMEPRISGNTVESKQPLSEERCVSNKAGTWLHCKSPKMYGDAIKQIKSVDIHLIMDGVVGLYNLSRTNPLISRFRYYPDPILHQFSGDNHVFKYSKNIKEVEIKGKNITLVVKKEDIHITIDDSIPCEVTHLALSSIKCVPKSMPFENITKNFKLEVKVYISSLTYNVGWLLYVETTSIFANATVISLTVILSLIIIFIAITCYCLFKKKAFSKKRQIPHTARYFNGGDVSLDVFGRLLPTTTNEYTERQEAPGATTYATGATSGNPLIDEYTLLLLKDQKLLIPKEALLLKDKIGQGHFGCVHRAFLFKPGEKGESLVAVKTLHKDNPREIDVKAFLTEAIIMKDFYHENILSLIGICLGKDQMPLVVLPYMLHGDLLSYLRDVNNQPTIKDLIVFGISIASGMDYLSKLKFVHRDLAARNCMLDEKLIVKVADFGLSRDIYERDYYSSDNKKSKLPVKWMALESLETGNYNIKTDVWSYGVVLWELFTRGVNPYPTVDNWDMPKFLKSGRRMDKPDYCPSKTYDIMLRCWEVDQNLRPDFATIVEELTELSQMEKHSDIAFSQIMYYENVSFALNNNIKPTSV